MKRRSFLLTTAVGSGVALGLRPARKAMRDARLLDDGTERAVLSREPLGPDAQKLLEVLLDEAEQPEAGGRAIPGKRP